MRQTLSVRRFPVLVATALLFLSAWHAWAAEGESVSVHVQGVLASGEGQVTPKVAPTLSDYASVLKRFGFGKYEDIGGGNGVVKTGQATTIKVGSHTIELTLVEIDKGTAKVKYTVKDSGGHSIGSNVMALPPDQTVAIQIGEPAFPIILLFQAGK